MLILSKLFGTKQYRDLKRLMPVVNAITEHEPALLRIDKQAMMAKTDELKEKLKAGINPDSLIPQAFALAREAARRVLGERLYDVQLFGSIALYQGRIMEMKTGEGKTLAAVPAAYLRALEGKGIHIVTVNDYLALRDAEWMGPVFAYLGVSVGVIQSNMATEARKAAYRKDITYATNNELGFDYLRDNMRLSLEEKAQRGHYYCMIDEIDSILIDESRTPLIVSGSRETDTQKYYAANTIVSLLKECEKDPKTGTYPEEPQGDYKLDEKGKRVQFTVQGFDSIEKLLQQQKQIEGSLLAEENFEFVHYVTQAVRAQKLYHRDKEYVVQNGKVEIVDEFTGRILHGRRYSEGLHQAIEVKERIKAANQSTTIATITLQNYFRMYTRLSGMTGTASTESTEFAKIYGLDVVEIPTNRPVRRDDQQDLIFPSAESKYTAIAKEIERAHKAGQPILVGTVSVERSERIAQSLKRLGIRHEILNAKNHEREAHIIAEAGAMGAVTIATNMAGRGTDIKLGGNPEFRTAAKVQKDKDPDAYARIYKKEYAQWQKQYESVKKLGGLFVLGTERHESRRIDNQLRGRSGRQGDPGRSQFFVSLDDDLMRLFGGSMQTLRNYLSKGLEEGESIHHPMITKSLERAQKRVEERNFDIRKHLLEFDNVLNSQRDRIYTRRNELLVSKTLQTRIADIVAEELPEIFAAYLSSGDAIDFKAGVDALQSQLFFTSVLSPSDNPQSTVQAIREEILTSLRKKEAAVGEDRWNTYICYTYVAIIDRNWQDHLSLLDSLREAVYLRSYAQKNPLLEYKLEGFTAFDAMIARIRITLLRRLIATQVSNERRKESLLDTPSQTQHRSLSMFGNRPPKKAQSGSQQTVRRSVPKVGRNEPCPCGSGKKYKNCHGRT